MTKLDAGRVRPFGGGCPARCRCDHSTRRDLGPMLTSLEVIEEIVAAACRKTAMRAAALRAGEMSPEASAAADERLVNWLAATLSGANPAFGTTEGWNPQGLAAYLEQSCPEAISQALGRDPDSAEAWAEGAARLLVKEIRRELAAGRLEDGAPQALLERWGALLTGAPQDWRGGFDQEG